MTEEEERKAYTFILDEFEKFENSFGTIFCEEEKEYIKQELLPLVREIARELVPLVREVARMRVLIQVSEIIIDENETNPTQEKGYFAHKLIRAITRLLDESELDLTQNDSSDDSNDDNSDRLPICLQCFVRHEPRE